MKGSRENIGGGCKCAAGMDLEKFFDSAGQSKLMEALGRMIKGGRAAKAGL
jgi:hypothetical protein